MGLRVKDIKNWENQKKDLVIEDVISAKIVKKKINCGSKGKRGERELVFIFNERFKEILDKNPSWGTFSRSLGSGNRWASAPSLPKHAQDTFGGDLVCPSGNFKFCIESKCGYNEIDLNASFSEGHKKIDAFLEQAGGDAIRCGRVPILLWKKDRKDCLAFVRTIDLEGDYQYKMKYREWTIILLADLLKLPDSYFFVN